MKSDTKSMKWCRVENKGEYGLTTVMSSIIGSMVFLIAFSIMQFTNLQLSAIIGVFGAVCFFFWINSSEKEYIPKKTHWSDNSMFKDLPNSYHEFYGEEKETQ